MYITRHKIASGMACIFSILLSVQVSASVLFDFNTTNLGVSSGYYNSVGMTIDGLSVTITAFTIDNDGNGNISAKTLLTGNGLGVYVSGNSNNLGVKSNSTDGSHLDGGTGGTDQDEGLMFTFSQVVNLEYINFDSFSSDSTPSDDFNLTVDDARILWDFNYQDSAPFVTILDTDEYGFTGVAGTSFLIWADGSSDDFRVDRIRVPEPTTVLLLGIGLLALGFRRLTGSCP